MSLLDIVQKLFEDYHPNLHSDYQIEKRSLITPEGQELLIQRSTLSRKSYEYAINNPVNNLCPLCADRKGLVVNSQFVVVPDNIPFTFSQMVILPLKKVNNTKNDNFHYDVRSVTKKEHHCRPNLNINDLEGFTRLISLVPDLMITQSELGSGASIPRHIHAHLFPKKRFSFPLLANCFFIPINNTPEILINTNITFALGVYGNPAKVTFYLDLFRQCSDLPANRIFYWNDNYSKVMGIYIPRTNEIPPSIGYIKDGNVWRFGCFEVLGLFDVKSDKLFETITATDLKKAINETTLQDHHKRQQLIDKICSHLSKDSKHNLKIQKT